MTTPEGSFERDLRIAIQELNLVRAENRVLVKNAESDRVRVTQLQAQVSALQQEIRSVQDLLATAQRANVGQLDDLTVVRADRERLRNEVEELRGRVRPTAPVEPAQPVEPTP